MASTQARPGPLVRWDDLSLNRVFLVIACTIVLVTATIAWQASGTRPGGACAVMSPDFPWRSRAACWSSRISAWRIQFFLLRFGGRGLMYFALFLFLAWILPLVAGTILMASMLADGKRTRVRSCSVSARLPDRHGLPHAER